MTTALAAIAFNISFYTNIFCNIISIQIKINYNKKLSKALRQYRNRKQYDENIFQMMITKVNYNLISIL
jgi:hypothetical protein